MIHNFVKSPVSNSLAVLVLLALIISWIISIVLSLRNAPVEVHGGWFAAILPVFSLLGIPAALDLLQTHGLTLLIAGVVFIVFVLNTVIPVLVLLKSPSRLADDWHKWSMLVCSIGGLAVAGYLTSIELAGVQVSCGPSGGCEAVQNSKYAILLGVLPIGLMGLAGYMAILTAWIAVQFGPINLRKIASLSLWGLCIFGALFSIYLTFLEPFVIGATCMWCISSAVLMVILILESTPGAQRALAISADEL